MSTIEAITIGCYVLWAVQIVRHCPSARLMRSARSCTDSASSQALAQLLGPGARRAV
jgi:hypothetical protein